LKETKSDGAHLLYLAVSLLLHHES
jgi:hypothetical protein